MAPEKLPVRTHLSVTIDGDLAQVRLTVTFDRQDFHEALDECRSKLDDLFNAAGGLQRRATPE